MVNIVDCARNVMGDKFAFVKMFLLSIPFMLSAWAYFSENEFLSMTLYIVFGVMLLAMFFETIKRSLNNENMLIPSFLMPIPMFWTLLWVAVASVLPLAVSFGLWVGTYSLLQNNTEVLNNQTSLIIIDTILSFLVASIYFATVTQYLDSGKIKDAFNVIKIAKSIKTFLVDFIFFVVQLLLFNAVTLVLLWVIAVIWGNASALLIVYSSILLSVNYFIFADYIAQTKKDADCNL